MDRPVEKMHLRHPAEDAVGLVILWDHDGEGEGDAGGTRPEAHNRPGAIICEVPFAGVQQ